MSKNISSGKERPTRESMKKDTLNKLQIAIDRIKQDGRRVTRKELMDISGLSSGTLSKPYVKELFKENEVCQFSPESISRKESKSQTLADVMYENHRLKAVIKDMDRKYAELEKQYIKAVNELNQSGVSREKIAHKTHNKMICNDTY